MQKSLQETKITISNGQAVKLKEYSKEGILSPETVQMILAEEKPKKRKYVIREERIRKYFPDHYSNKDMERIIIQLLEEWKSRLGNCETGLQAWFQKGKELVWPDF